MSHGLHHGSVTVRPGTKADAPALTALRNHFIAHSTATFDESPLSADAVGAWIGSFAREGPHRLLVACDGFALLGFACSRAYRPHPAFSRTVECSIYLAPQHTGRGLGRLLYIHLFHALAGEPVHRALAGIALPNPASVALHERMGFTPVGVFDGYAFKHGQAISSMWMQRVMQDA